MTGSMTKSPSQKNGIKGPLLSIFFVKYSNNLRTNCLLSPLITLPGILVLKHNDQRISLFERKRQIGKIVKRKHTYR